MALWRAVMKIGVDSSELEAGLKKVDSSFASLGKSLAGYFSIGAVAAFTQSLVNAAEAVQDLSEQLGISTDEVQALQRAAARSGVELNKYVEILVKIKRAKADALSGDATAQGRFKALGVNANQSEFEIMRGIGNAQTPEQMAAAFDLIGTKAGKALNSLKEIRELGPLELITPENAAILSKAKDDIGDLWTTVKAIITNPIGDRLREISILTSPFINQMFGRRTPYKKNFTPLDQESEPGMSEYDKAIQSQELNSAHMRDIAKSPKAIAAKIIAQAFSPIPSDSLARIGGGYGSGIDAGSREREMLMFTRKISEDIREIKGKIESVPTEAAP